MASTDFGNFFDEQNAQYEAKQAEVRANRLKEREAEEARVRELSKPLNDIARPVLNRAAIELAARGVELTYPDLPVGTEVSPANLRLALGRKGWPRKNSVYLFQVLKAGWITVTKMNLALHHRNCDEQVLRVKTSEFEASQVEGIVKQAIEELFSDLRRSA